MSRLNAHTFAFLDVETTGLSPWFGDRVCEVAIIRCEEDKVIDSFDSLLNPERPLSPGAARVNGLKDSELKKAPKFNKVAEKVLTLARDAVIVCHNVPFDMGFLSAELGGSTKTFPPSSRWTLSNLPANILILIQTVCNPLLTGWKSKSPTPTAPSTTP